MENKSNNAISIVYACNEAIFDGLYLSILTILRRSKSIFNFYILSGDLTSLNSKYKNISSKHQSDLIQLIKSYNQANEIHFVDCTELYFKILKQHNVDIKTKFWHSPYVIFRLLIDQIIDVEKLIYLDVDTLANGDIKELYDINIENYELGVCHDKRHSNRLKKEYFNAGVLLINLSKIKESHLFEHSLKYLFKNHPLYQDQDSLNYCANKVLFFPNEYRFNYQGRRIKKDTIIKHFVYSTLSFFIKPWQIKRVKYVLFVRCFDEDYKIFKKYKKGN